MKPTSERPHLSRGLLDDYFLGRLPPHDLVAEVARILRAECAECREGLAAAGPDYERAVREAALRAQAEVGELEAARWRLPEVLQGLTAGWPDGLIQVAAEERFHTTAFLEFELDAAWAAVAGEAWGAARQAAELASAAAGRLPVARYGRIVVARLEAETELVSARVAVSLGRDRAARQALEAAEASGAVELSGELEAGILVGRAVLALREGDRRAARRLLERARRPTGASAGRWEASVATTLAVLERRAGRAESAVERLEELLAGGRDEVPGPGGWRAAQALVESLVASSRSEEAEARVAAWQEAVTARAGGRVPGEVEVAELAHLRGRVLRGRGQPEPAAEVLWRAFVGYAALGLGLRAAAAVGELARVLLLAAGPGAPAERLPGAVEELVARCDLPAEGLEALAGFAGAMIRGTLDARDVNEFEDRLVEVDPPWEPARHAR